MLQNHQFVQSALLYLGRHVIFVVGGAVGSFFLRVGKGAHALKSLFAYEVEEFVEILICLAWESDHQRSADVNAWHAFADSLQQIDGFLLRYVAMHAGEHVVADVLEGNVEIFAYVWLLAHHVQKIHWELVWISVMQANPFHARNISHLADEFGNMMFSVNIHAVVGEFLSDNLKLLHAFSNQFAHLLQNFFFWSGNVLAGNDRNGAVGTVAVAAFGYLDVGIMARGGKMALAVAG